MKANGVERYFNKIRNFVTTYIEICHESVKQIKNEGENFNKVSTYCDTPPP